MPWDIYSQAWSTSILTPNRGSPYPLLGTWSVWPDEKATPTESCVLAFWEQHPPSSWGQQAFPPPLKPMGR